MNQLGLVFSLLSMVTRGLNKLPLRISLLSINEAFATTIASLVAMVVFGIPLLILGWGSTMPSLTAVLVFASVGVINNGVGRIFVWKSIASIGANRSNILAATQNVYAVVLAALFLSSPVSINLLLGLALVVLGVALISSKGGGKLFTPKQMKVGIIYGLIGAFMWGVGQDLMQVGVTLYNGAVGASFLTYSLSLLALVPSLLFTRIRTKDNGVFAINKKAFFYVSLGAFLGNLGFYFTYVALNYIPVTVTAVINGVNPVVTLLGSYVFIRKAELIDKRTILAVALSVVGVTLAAL